MSAKHKASRHCKLPMRKVETLKIFTEGIKKGYGRTYKTGAKLYYQIILGKSFPYKLHNVLENKLFTC